MQRDTLKRELYAEFLGTLVLIAIGSASVAQNVLSKGQNGSYFAINVAWGLAVTMAIYVAGGVSGAHLNPAVTLALAMRRGFSWRKVIPYSIVQTAGAFCGAAITYFIYREAFSAYDNGVRMVSGDLATAGIFATYPQPFLSTFGGLVDQIIATAILVLVILAISDTRNIAPSANVGPLIVGLLVVVIGIGFGFNCGYAINPARDLGPRLFTLIAGWGTDVFRAGNNWFWVPIFGPLIGGAFGALVYDNLIGKHFVEKKD